jgi:hypothetical protein
MYWYILIFSILCLIVYYTSLNEGFTSINLTVADSIANISDSPTSPTEVAFGSNTFHSEHDYYISTHTNPTNILMEDIKFCKAGAQVPNPFSDSRFASTCGICMTQGTVLLDKFPFSQTTNRGGTGVVVYKEDKDYSLKDGSQAIPSAHSAFCDTLLIPDALPKNLSPHNLTGLAINAQQYADTTAYLNSVNILSFANTECSPRVSQPITCSNANATISSLRFLYGHFTNDCEAGSNVKVQEKPTDCIGEQSCTFTRNLPEGKRQWFLDAECKIQETPIPPGLSNVFQRSLTGLPSSLSNVPTADYYWADPYNSLSPDTVDFTLYSECSVPNDTQVQIEFCTSASIELYLHTLKKYSHRGTGNTFVYMSNSPAFTLYKGSNTIKLKVKSKHSTKNGLYFKIKDLNGATVKALDSTWMFSTAQGFVNPPYPIAKYPAQAKILNSNVSFLSPVNSSTRTINYFKEISLQSPMLLTLGTLLFHRAMTQLDPTFTYSTYLTYNGVEKEITRSKGERAQTYTEHFPAGITNIRISVTGDGDTCVSAILSDVKNNVIASTDSSWTCDEKAYSGPKIELLMHCDPFSQRLAALGPGTYTAGDHYDTSASFIKVPVGLNAVLTSTAGTTKIVAGGKSFNFCQQGEFNDKTAKIVVTAGPPKVDQTPTPTPIPARSYSIQNFLAPTRPGTDLPNQPIIKTVDQCKAVCDAEPTCLGFSRPKGVDPATSHECWLKKNTDSKIQNYPFYQTYVKN